MSDQPTQPIQTRVHLTHLRAWRLWRGYSQGELAHKARVAKSTVANLETGKMAANWVTVGKLAEALDVGRRQLTDTAPAEEMPTMPLAVVPLAVVPSAAPESPEAEAHAAFWEAKRQLAFTLPEPARTAMLEMYSMKQYGRGDADLARRIHAEHVVDASPSPSPAPDDAPAETPATPEPSRRR